MKTPHAVLAGLAVLATCVSAAAAGPSTKQQVTIFVKGRGVAGDATGTFTLRGAASDSGTSHVGANTTAGQRVAGRQIVPGRTEGLAELHGKNGDLKLFMRASVITVTASSVSTIVQSGTWRITKGTGTYKGWRGSGTFVSVDRNTPAPNDHTPMGVGSYEGRWIGHVTH
jgi:hypothetical protein